MNGDVCITSAKTTVQDFPVVSFCKSWSFMYILSMNSSYLWFTYCFDCLFKLFRNFGILSCILLFIVPASERVNNNIFITEITERRVWRCQRGNQNSYIEEEQTIQWSKEKVQKDKQRSIKTTYKTKYRVTRTPIKTGGELGCSGRVSSSCSTSDTRRVNLVTHPWMRKERESVYDKWNISVVICDTYIP
jgi:hypothetical protein